MAGLRFYLLKSLRDSASLSSNPRAFRLCNYRVKTSQYTDETRFRPLYTHVSCDYRAKGEKPVGKVGSITGVEVLNSKSLLNVGCNASRPSCSFSPKSSNPLFGRAVPLLSACSFPRYYSWFSSSSPSSSSGNDTKSSDQAIPASSSASEVNVSDIGGGNEWLDRAKDLWHSAVDAAAYSGQKAKEASAELSPHVEQLLDSHPYLNEVVVPVSLTFTGTLLAWFVMPRLLRRFHKYASQGQAALLSGSLAVEEVPYEKSFWGALEDPVRYLVTFMAFTQIGMMVAPTTIASQYLTPAWRGALILSFVWFLHRWKTNVFARALVASTVVGLEREKLLALDKISSVGLFVIGIMALAEACGVAVQSILTVGGIGGVATAFAARDILGNVLSGLSMQFSKPFSIGDTIKAGSIEGQVVEMGLTTTLLLNAEKFPVIVPNSLFSSQIIVNKSRAEWRAIINKIPLQINDLDKIPQIANEINNMLRSHAKVFLGKEAPYCFLSRIESSFAELTIGCNLKRMRKEELYLTEQDILLHSVQIIKQHGAKLGSTYQDIAGQ